MTQFPICKSCSFLAIDYYEEISNTFEECLLETLIPESTFLLNENGAGILKTDKTYKTPWDNIQYDATFISCEAKKVENSIALIAGNTEPFSNDFNWISACQNKYSCEGFNKEEILHEKELNIYRGKVLPGTFPLLDVPQVPFSLLKARNYCPSLETLLKVFPIMDIEDPFDFEDSAFEDHEFFNVEPEEEIKFFCCDNEQMTFEELKLPKLTFEEYSEKLFTNFHDDKQVKNVSQICEQKYTASELTRSSMVDCNYTVSGIKNIFDDCSNMHTKDDVNIRKKSTKFVSPINVDRSKTEDLFSPKEMFNKHSEGALIDPEHTSIYKLSQNMNCTVNMFSESQHLNQYSTQIKTIDCGTFSDVKNTNNDKLDYTLDELPDPSKSTRIVNNFEELETTVDMPDYQNQSCVFPMEELSQFHQYSHDEDTNTEDSPTLNSDAINSYKEKLSNLQYQTNVDMKSTCVTERKAQLGNNQNPSPFFNSKALTSEPTDKIIKRNVDKMKPCSLNLSRPVDLLSGFIQRKFSFQSSNPKTDDSFKELPGSTSYKQYGNLVSKLQAKESRCTEDKFQSKEFDEESIPMLVHLEIKNLLVELPENYVRMLLSLEETAVPVLQSLMISDNFTFSPNLTLADIPPYKTCFLLNQEIKSCKDKNFKGFYEKLIENLEHEIDEWFENNSVHPKVKQLCQYLCEKYEFCKENNLKFKVIIILKKNLQVIFSSFDWAIKQNQINFRIHLIPENVILSFDTLIFKDQEETVYFINSSSISNDIPWSDLSFVIEFEPDNNSPWKQICNEQNIPHAFVRVINLPFKSLKDIQKLIIPAFDKAVTNPPKEDVKLLIVSASITSQYQLLYLLESKFQYTICIRHYAEILPLLHFADIVIDEKSALILVNNTLFSVEEFAEKLYEKISFLHLKYEICWIIIQSYIDKKSSDALKCMKTQNNFHKFYLSMVQLDCRNQSCKIKIFFANNVQETTDLIKQISSASLLSKEGVKVQISVPSQVTKEEIFLCSFPSLNPFVANLLLSDYSLHEILNFTAEDMCRKFDSVPVRFLQCFYSTNHKIYSLPSLEVYDKQHEVSRNSSLGSSSDSSYDFTLKPNFPEKLNYPQQISGLRAICYEQEEDIEDLEIPKKLTKYTTDAFGNQNIILSPSQEKYLHELDLDYMSLKISNKYEQLQNSYDDDEDDIPSDHSISNSIALYNSISKENQQEDSYCPFTFETLSSQISNDSHRSFERNADRSTNYSNPHSHLSKAKSEHDFVSQMEHRSVDLPVSQFHSISHRSIDNSPRKIRRPPLDFNQFKYNNNKRKLSSSDENSPVSQKVCRIQKGMVSKTVSKQDVTYNSPFDSQTICHSQSSNRKEAKVFPFMIRKNCFESSQNVKSKTSALAEDGSNFKSQHFSQWSDSQGLGSIPLTPRVKRRLGYEGVSGQTRLVFQ
ncbi:hypothetical protein JTE90_008042 [Oedothorax gibbosus]|uniref:Shortage in chiasmata 1 n=1 Tax=Oedothorax gibbosus TaxID=931172 RepID=A0AAV6UXD3_9ARAC|nr:hypothetical protein JTE90_008042 [Oedothorax gibbosus]